MGGIASKSAAAFSPDPGTIAVPGNVGYVLTVGANGKPQFQVAAAGGPQVATKAADETRAVIGSSNDATLIFNNQPAGTYAFDCGLYFVTATVAPLIGFNRSGTFVSGVQNYFAVASGALGGASSAIDGSTFDVAVLGGVPVGFARLVGTFVFTTTCSMVVQWGCSANGGSVTLKQGSWAMLTKV